MPNQDQEKRLQWFSRVGFLFTWIYLLRARQYLFAILAFVLPYGFWYINGFLSLIIWIGIGVFVWIKGKKLAFDKTKKSFEEFKKSYTKASKVFKIVFFVLIWLIIIWIFSAALLPRLVGVRSRAYDITRKNDLNQTTIAMVGYYTDNHKYPPTGWCLSDVKWLVPWYLTSLPKDPNTNNSFSGISTLCTTPWEYLYVPMIKSWVVNWWFILVAKTETEHWSNWVFDKSISLETTTLEAITLCKNIIKSTYTKNMNNWVCYYIHTWDLWYIALPTQEILNMF